MNREMCFMNRGKYDEALKAFTEALTAFTEALKRNSEDADTHYNKGLVLSELGRHPEALKAFDKAIALNSQDSRAHYGRGDALAALGDHEGQRQPMKWRVVSIPSLPFLIGHFVHSLEKLATMWRMCSRTSDVLWRSW